MRRLGALLLVMLGGQATGNCPPGYTLRTGDVPGWGSISGQSKFLDQTITDCKGLCDSRNDCCSFEWSPTSRTCNLNKECKPSVERYQDYKYCQQNRTDWVRLSSYPRGRVELYKEGQWGTLCGHFWWNNQKGAENICKELGYAGGIKYTAPGGSGPILAGNRLCNGSEATVWDCPLLEGRTETLGCTHDIDQGVSCTNACERVPAITSETHYDQRFRASNILTESQDVWNSSSPPNYWITKNGIKGPDAHFTQDLQCIRDIGHLTLINTHNAYNKDRSTKKFRLLGSKTSGGTFKELMVASLPDSRQQDPVPALRFDFPQTSVRFVRFEILDFWGGGGGLQFFEVHSGTQPLEAVSATMSSIRNTDFPAEKCIDGVESSSSSLCHTKSEKAPWLALDFGAQVWVDKVVIHNRDTECCWERLRNAEVRVADQLPASGQEMFSGGALLGTFTGPGEDGQVVTMTSSTGIGGRFVILQLDLSPGTGVLNLNEVTVWGRKQGDNNIVFEENNPEPISDEQFSQWDAQTVTAQSMESFSGIPSACGRGCYWHTRGRRCMSSRRGRCRN